MNASYFIFSKGFYLGQGPGGSTAQETPGARQDHTLDGIPVQHKAQCTYIYTLIQT